MTAADPALLAAPAVPAMADRLTVPFARGADTLALTLLPGPSPDRLKVAPYDFTEHRARFGSWPEPAYLLRRLAGSPAGLRVLADFDDPVAGPGQTALDLPAGLEPGDSWLLVLPATAGPDTRLTGLRIPVETAPPGTTLPVTTARYQLTALLGVTARLLWVLGVERERLTQRRRQLTEQRRVDTAAGASLDLIGSDLAVPRFPPTPYSVDASTVGLWHCDDAPGAVPALTDACAAFPGRTPHHGTLAGSAEVGVPGRYGTGLTLPGPTASATVAGHPDFDVAADQGLTVELFVRPAPGSALGPLVARSAAGSGWSIEVGDLGLGTANAVRAAIGDGTVSVTADAAVDLPIDRFSHLAVVLDRDAAAWSVFVDGTVVARSDASGLGAVAPAADLVVGGSAVRAVVDEIRVSSVARSGFHPVLGESDDQYRRRLGLFRRWVLPTPAGLQSVLNSLVPQLDGHSDPFVISDVDAPTRTGHRMFRVWPAALAPHQSIDADGRLSVSDGGSRTGGNDPVEPADPALLGRYADPGQVAITVPVVDRARPAGIAPADYGLMQPPVAAGLDRLVSLLAGTGLPGPLRLVGGFDPAVADVRAAGLSVVLRHPSVGPSRLAALAHRAGFDLVENAGDGTVRAGCRPGRMLVLGPDGSGDLAVTGGLPEVGVGDTVTLGFALPRATYTPPTLPADAEVDFSLVLTGRGRGVLTRPDPTAPTAELTLTAPGLLSVTADLFRDAAVVGGGGGTLGSSTSLTCSASLLVRPTPLGDGDSITADGLTGVPVDVLGPVADPDDPTPFDPALLTAFDDPRIDFGADPDHRRLQPSVTDRLTALVDRLAADAVPGSLVVLAGYDPAAGPGDPASRGRVVRLQHPNVTAGDLAVRAYLAGFGWVGRSGSEVVAAEPAGDLVRVTGPDEVEVGAAVTLEVVPDPADVSPTTRLSWSSGQPIPTTPDEQGVALRTLSGTAVEAVGTAPGRAWVQAGLREVGAAGPYAFTVTLRPELAGARISRDDYYLVMNALNTLHPLGVEVLTESIRNAVVELAGSPDGLDPSFTYPAFRLHRAAATLRRPDPTAP